MSQQNELAELSLLEIAPELFTPLHFEDLLQKLKWQFLGQQIFQELGSRTHLSALRLVANLAQL
jgi:hypothetical protein